MILAVICVVAVSCERDGVYQPKKKISKIYYDYVTGKGLYCTWVYIEAGTTDFEYDVEDEYPTRMTYHSRRWQVSPSYPDTSHTTYTYYFEYMN